MRGFIFTIDAMLALFMLSTLIVFSMDILGTHEIPMDLSYTARNLGTVLEKDGTLDRGDFIELRKKLADLSGPYCSSVSIEFFDPDMYEVNELDISVMKPFCTGYGSKVEVMRTFTYDYQAIENTTIVRAGYGIAKISVWSE
jgi:hypothetical protein